MECNFARGAALQAHALRQSLPSRPRPTRGFKAKGKGASLPALIRQGFRYQSPANLASRAYDLNICMEEVEGMLQAWTKPD